MSVIVFADNKKGEISKSSFEAIAYGKKIADSKGGTCTVVTYGDVDQGALSTLGQYGAGKVVLASEVKTCSTAKLSKVIDQVAAQNGAEYIVFSMDFAGKAIAPMVAAKLKAGIVSGAIALPNADGLVRKNVFSGKAYADIKFSSDKKVITLTPNSFGFEKSTGTANVESFSGDLGEDLVVVKEFKKAGGEGILLTDADLVVSAGRGLKGPENWNMIETLATEMGAATACSRPVADIGWRPHHEHVGQTGVTVRPNLYIAIGISGAIQHLAGVNGSKVMVVINTDPEAPFFKAADYGIVGDAFDVVPKLIEAYKKFKASNN